MVTATILTAICFKFIYFTVVTKQPPLGLESYNIEVEQGELLRGFSPKNFGNVCKDDTGWERSDIRKLKRVSILSLNLGIE